MKAYLLTLGVGLASILSGCDILFLPALAQESTAEMLADHIRRQGHRCDKALSAVRDAALSKPDEAVWVLKCTDVTYRLTLIQDMAWKIELSRQPLPRIVPGSRIDRGAYRFARAFNHLSQQFLLLCLDRCNLTIEPRPEEIDDLSHQTAWPPSGLVAPLSFAAAFAAPTRPAARKALTTSCARSIALISVGVSVTVSRLA